MDEVLRSLGNIEGTLASLVRQYEEEKNERKSLDKRVTSLERKQWWLSGVGGTLAFFFGVVIKMWR